jgi:hypothetical protein
MTRQFWQNMQGVKFSVGIPEMPTDANIARVLLFLERCWLARLHDFELQLSWIDTVVNNEQALSDCCMCGATCKENRRSPNGPCEGTYYVCNSCDKVCNPFFVI